MRTKILGPCVILLGLACATSYEQPHRRTVVSVVFPWSTIAGTSEDLSASLSEVIDTDEFVLNFFCMNSEEYLPRLLGALAERGDSIIVGLGRPVVPALSDAATRNPGTVFFWIGWGPPPTALPPEVQSWWVEPDSLQRAVAELAIRQNTPKAVALVGDVVSPEVLSLLRRNEMLVEQHSSAESLSYRPSVVQPEVPALLLVLERPRYITWGDQIHILWAAEGPPGFQKGLDLELRTDWLAAVSNAVDWYLDRGGIPPGAGSDRWLSVQHSESGDDST